MPQTIAIGADHAGFMLKNAVIKTLKEKGYQVADFGTGSPESVDYPDFAHPVAEAVVSGRANLGIVICGSGNGVCMTVNKHAGIRGAIAWNRELAELARQHNDANILCLAARFINEATALDIVDGFLTATFEGGRHERRVNKITE